MPLKEIMEESRAPSIEDLLKLCKELNQRGPKYLIVGGMAMTELGFARDTEDIDLLKMKQGVREKDIMDRKFLDQILSNRRK